MGLPGCAWLAAAARAPGQRAADSEARAKPGQALGPSVQAAASVDLFTLHAQGPVFGPGARLVSVLSTTNKNGNLVMAVMFQVHCISTDILVSQAEVYGWVRFLCGR